MVYSSPPDVDGKPIDLGDTVEDTITGFSGVVVGIMFWLNNCARPLVQPRSLKEGQLMQSEAFDSTQLRLKEKTAVRSKHAVEQKPGGPMPTPRRV